MTELRQALLGGWLLESFVSRDADTGVQRYPFGEHPAGLILYTTDGYMSAQLTPGPGGEYIAYQSAPGPAHEYIAYGGRFHVDEQSATVRHDVLVSTRPELLTQKQFRHAQVDGDRLTLSASQTTAEGVTTHSTLVWRRNPKS